MHDHKQFDPGGFATRLRDLISPEKNSLFCERAGISISVLNKYLAANEGLNPSVDVVVRICEATRSSIDWLVLGNGDSPEARHDIVDVPVYDIKLAAGNGAIAFEESLKGSRPFTRDELKAIGRLSAEGLAVVEADGDSMEPIISDGASVLIDRNDQRLREGIFAFRLGDNLRIKRLRHFGLNGVEAISANQLYPPEQFDGPIMQHFQIIGRAIWTATKL